MKDVFWKIFRETGEPMCYLLSKADMELYDLPGERLFAADAAVTDEIKAKAEREKTPSATV